MACPGRVSDGASITGYFTVKRYSGPVVVDWALTVSGSGRPTFTYTPANSTGIIQHASNTLNTTVYFQNSHLRCASQQWISLGFQDFVQSSPLTSWAYANLGLASYNDVLVTNAYSIGQDNCSSSSTSRGVFDGVLSRTGTEVDLSIDSAPTVAQVVYSPDIDNNRVIDLVADKPAVALVRVRATGVKPGDTRTLRVSGQLGNQAPEFSKDIALSDIPADGKEVEVYFRPTIPGPSVLQIKVDADDVITEEDEGQTSNFASVSLTIKETLPLNVTYIRFGGCVNPNQLTCYNSVTPDAAESTRAFNDNLVRFTYPISNSNYQTSLSPAPYLSQAWLRGHLPVVGPGPVSVCRTLTSLDCKRTF